MRGKLRALYYFIKPLATILFLYDFNSIQRKPKTHACIDMYDVIHIALNNETSL